MINPTQASARRLGQLMLQPGGPVKILVRRALASVGLIPFKIGIDGLDSMQGLNPESSPYGRGTTLSDRGWYSMRWLVPILKGIRIAVIVGVLSSSTAYARCEWSASDLLWLARAQVGEAGWRSARDHDAIAHLLYRRWKDLRTRHPDVTPASVITGYSRALDGRRPWILFLNREFAQPNGWVKKWGKWESYRGYWRTVLERAEAWCSGGIPDPCRGRADHWDRPPLSPSTTLRRVDCNSHTERTKNIFYRELR